MTLLSEIQAAQSQWLFPLVRKRLLVRTPLTLVGQFNPDHLDLRFFDSTNYTSDDDDSSVYLVLFPKYAPLDDFAAERGYKNQYNGTGASASTKRLAFEASIIQSPFRYYEIVQQLSNISESSGNNQHKAIQVIDFCFPDAGSVVYSGGDKGVVRNGRIDILTKPDGIVSWEGQSYCLSPWEFKFTSVQLGY